MFQGMLLNSFVPFASLVLACKNYVLCMPECVGNYSIPTQNGNVEGADTLAGAAILNILNIYVQHTPVNTPNFSVDNYGDKFPQFYINNSCPNCQFLGLTCTGQCYWYHVLSCPERDQLQNCLDNALAKLENWLKASKHT